MAATTTLTYPGLRVIKHYVRDIQPDEKNEIVFLLKAVGRSVEEAGDHDIHGVRRGGNVDEEQLARQYFDQYIANNEHRREEMALVVLEDVLDNEGNYSNIHPSSIVVVRTVKDPYHVDAGLDDDDKKEEDHTNSLHRNKRVTAVGGSTTIRDAKDRLLLRMREAEDQMRNMAADAEIATHGGGLNHKEIRATRQTYNSLSVIAVNTKPQQLGQITRAETSSGIDSTGY